MPPMPSGRRFTSRLLLGSGGIWGSPPSSPEPTPTTVKLPEAAATPAADRVDGKEYSHNGKIYIWRATDGKWEPK
jgi:hypothetical protein